MNHKNIPVRKESELYPDFGAEIRALDEQGATPELVSRIIERHKDCRERMIALYRRYEVLDGHVPIFNRQPRFPEDETAINNRISNDFFGEICDFKIGYFAGKPIAYSYNRSKDSTEDTGGEEAVEEIAKALSDFVALNNFPDVDMELTKFATVCGYAGRLLYYDTDGQERVRCVKPFQAAILSRTGDMTQPDYAVWYYPVTDLNGSTKLHAEFYSAGPLQVFEGQLGALEETELPAKQAANLFERCPLQGVPNNLEMLGDAEKVLPLIDDYDRSLSDQSNDVESFASAYMVWDNVQADDKDIERAQNSGTFITRSKDGGKVYFLTKDGDNTLAKEHLDRVEDNIYRFSKTPNLNDEAFGTASGIALKFRLTGLETKCGMFQAKMQSAATYLFRCLSTAWAKRHLTLDPLEVDLKFSRNFPLDLLSEAQAAQQMIAAGLPKRVAYSLAFPEIDDVDEVMQEIEAEKDDVLPLDAEDGQVTEDGTTDDGRAAEAANAGASDRRTP